MNAAPPDEVDICRSSPPATPERASCPDFGIPLRSSMIAAPPTLRVAVAAISFGDTRTPIHGLTFHNSRFDQEVDGRFEWGRVARMERSVIRGMVCRRDTSHE